MSGWRRSYETVRPVSTPRSRETTALIGFAGSPWTVASYMVEGCSGSKEYARSSSSPMATRSDFRHLIDLLVRVPRRDYLNMQIEAGAEAVQLFDSWAGALPAAGIPALVHRTDRASWSS